MFSHPVCYSSRNRVFFHVSYTHISNSHTGIRLTVLSDELHLVTEPLLTVGFGDGCLSALSFSNFIVVATQAAKPFPHQCACKETDMLGKCRTWIRTHGIIFCCIFLFNWDSSTYDENDVFGRCKVGIDRYFSTIVILKSSPYMVCTDQQFHLMCRAWKFPWMPPGWP